MKPVAIDSIGVITPGAGDTAGSMGLIYAETRITSDLPRIAKRIPAPSGAKTSIPDDVMGLDRLVQLGSHALWQAVDEEMAKVKIALFVCAPTEDDEPELAGKAADLLAQLAAKSEIVLSNSHSRVLATGRDAILDALPLALNALSQPEVGAACVLGIDSPVAKPRLRRILERNGDFAPDAVPVGEAAAAVLLAKRPSAGALASLVGLAMIDASPGEKAVPAPPGSDVVRAIDKAVADAGLARPAFSGWVSDMKGGEHEKNDLAWAKNADTFAFSPNLDVAFPHMTVGDAGAAMGTLALATTAFFIAKQAWSGVGLCSFGSSTRRGAAILAPAK